MMFMDKAKKKYIAAFCYIMSLLPIFLPWCYFDKEIDGIKYGTDIVNNMGLIVLSGITFFSIIFCENQRGKILTKILFNPITIEEKIDGANLGISFNYNGELQLQNRGSYLMMPFEGQWKPLKNWLNCHENAIFDALMDRYILFGEWCYAKYSIYYNKLPDWFVGFDIYDIRENRFLSVQRRNRMLNTMKVTVVPQLGYGIYDVNELPGFFGKSRYGDTACERIYIRQDEEMYLRYRAKMVQTEFRQGITEHWFKRMLQCNKVC